MSVFKRLAKLSDGLRKTRQIIADGIRGVVGARLRITPEMYEDLEEVLLRADVGLQTTEFLVDRLREKVRESGLTDTAAVPGILREVVAEILRGASSPSPPSPPGMPRVLLVCGVNGVGKTTTIGKLAYRYVSAGESTLVVAGDTFRAAACEQLAIWAHRAGADFVRSAPGADPASVVFDGIRAGISRNMRVVILDTAGRLHAKGNLMAELQKIHRVVGKALPGAPHEVLLVLDATIGQNGIAQAHEFSTSAGVTGLVLTKLDGTAKGGVILAIARETRLPVRYVGLGEGIDDLDDFDPEAFAEALVRPESTEPGPAGD